MIGLVRSGNDGYNYNLTTGDPWSWHLDEDTIALADFTIEVCDGRPSYVEMYFPNYGAGQFCPWGSVVVDVVPDNAIDADTNVDGAVDQIDANKLALCMTAPGQDCYDIAVSCCQADINSDYAVDCGDWSAIESQWTDATPPTPPLLCSVPLVSTHSAPWLPLVLASLLGLVAIRATQRASNSP